MSKSTVQLYIISYPNNSLKKESVNKNSWHVTHLWKLFIGLNTLSAVWPHQRMQQLDSSVSVASKSDSWSLLAFLPALSPIPWVTFPPPPPARRITVWTTDMCWIPYSESSVLSSRSMSWKMSRMFSLEATKKKIHITLRSNLKTHIWQPHSTLIGLRRDFTWVSTKTTYPVL